VNLYRVLVEYFGREFERRLRKRIGYLGKDDPFKVLIRTIISQMTNWKNTRIALKRLESKLELTPLSIIKAPIEVIEDCLRPAGLYRVKARKLKILAKRVLEDLGGDFSKLKNKTLEEIRSYLMTLPGVGFKTADILLLFHYKYPIMPVDTHISRITRRLGLVGRSAGYEDIRRAVESTLEERDSDKMGVLHLMLIEFGRNVCTARRPKCDICPFKEVCEYYRIRSRSTRTL